MVNFYPDRLLRLKDVMTLVGLSKSTIYCLVKAGAFPDRYLLGARAVRWKECEVRAWMQNRRPPGSGTPPNAAPNLMPSVPPVPMKFDMASLPGRIVRGGSNDRRI